jgi:hypothetical protein
MEADYVSIIRQMHGTYFIGFKLAADILHAWGDTVVFLFQNKHSRWKISNLCVSSRTEVLRNTALFLFFNVTTFDFQLVSLAGRSCSARDR